MAVKKNLDDEFSKILTIADGSTEEVKKILGEEEKESKRKRDKVVDFLDSKRHILDYNTLVALLLLKRLSLNEWGDWTYQVAPTKKGVVMQVVSPDKRIFAQAFKTVRGPEDVTAIDIFAMRAQNTVDGFSNQNRGTGKS